MSTTIALTDHQKATLLDLGREYCGFDIEDPIRVALDQVTQHRAQVNVEIVHAPLAIITNTKALPALESGSQPQPTPAKTSRKAAPKKAAKPVIEKTPEQVASRKLQGRYLSLIRQFNKRARAQYSKMAKEHGRAVAIKAMSADLV